MGTSFFQGSPLQYTAIRHFLQSQEFFRIILGIESDAPYFEKVQIKPNLGEIEQISGHMPHPKGKISVKYNQSNDGLTAEVVLPESITGSFIWNNKVYPLDEGLNKLVIN